MKSWTSAGRSGCDLGGVAAVQLGDQLVERRVELRGRQLESQRLGDLESGFVLGTGVGHRQGGGDRERGDESIAVTLAELGVEVQREGAVALNEGGDRVGCVHGACLVGVDAK